MKKFFSKLISKIYRFLTLRVLYAIYYRISTKKNIFNNKIVFIENYSNSITDNFSLIFKKLEEYPQFKDNINVCFLNQNSVSRFSYIKNNLHMIKEISNAEFVLLNNPSDVIACLKFNPNTKIVQTWHACGAFKKFGLSSADGTFGTNKDIQNKYPYHAKYDLVTVSSPEVVWAYNEAMGFNNYNSNVNPIGVSRTDVFFNDEFISLANKKLHDILKFSKDKKIILYMPTFRGSTASAKAPESMNLDLMFNSLNKDYILLIKHHPLIKNIPSIPTKYDKFAFDCTSKFTPDELLCCADIFITDYSSAVFEFSLFAKPMLFLVPDLNDYYDERGFYYKYQEFVPGQICYSTEQLTKAIINIKQDDIQNAINFKNKFMYSCDGHSTDRIVDWILSKGGSSHVSS